VNRQRLRDNFSHAHPWIQRSERILENHLHPTPRITGFSEVIGS
jgi:hypothetical protein